MKRGLAVALMFALGACGLFGGDEETTPVIGNRVAILGEESTIAADPGLAATEIRLPPQARNSDWSQPGGNVTKSVGHLALGATPARVWTAEVGTGSSSTAYLNAAPVVEAGRIYAMDTRAVVSAFDAASGRSLWRHEIAKPGESEKVAFGGGVSAFGGRLYATSGYGIAAALDAATGAEIWRVNLQTPLRGAPTVDGTRVFVMLQDNQLVALDAATGERLWDVIGTVEPAGRLGAASPAVAQGTAVVGFSSGELNAVRVENGRTVWQDTLARTSRTTALSALSDVDAPPVIEGGRVFAIGHGGRMVALDLATGQRAWEQSLGGLSTPAVAGDWIFVVTTRAELVALSRADGRIRWVQQLPAFRDMEDRKGAISYYGPVLAGDRLWLTSSEGELIAASPYDGAVQSRVEAAKSIRLPPIVAGGTLYLLDEEARLSAYR